jgi:hypothetical protein
MKFFFPLLILAALISFLQPPAPALAAEDWTFLETKNPPDAVEIKISHPSSWQTNVRDSENEISRLFFHAADSPYRLLRSLLVTGTAYGEVDGFHDDISKYSKPELENFAKTIVDNNTGSQDSISKNFHSYELIKFNGLNALKIIFDNTYRVNKNIVFNLYEAIVTLYDQNYDNEHSFSSIVMLCTYSGLTDDKDKVLKAFNDEYGTVCQRFYSSLEILDKWQ